MYFKTSILLFFVVLPCISARIHNIEIKNDARKFIRLSTFAFNNEGILHIKFNNFTSYPDKQHLLFGLTFDRVHKDGMYSYLNNDPNNCVILQKILGEKNSFDKDASLIYFIFDLRNKKIKLQCSKYLDDIVITPIINNNLKGDNLTENVNSNRTTCSQTILPFNYVLENKNNYYSIEFTININTIKEKGLYNMFFHNCANYEDENNVSVNFSLEVEEKNGHNYLSLTERDLPKLYCIMALMYFLTGNYWTYILWHRKNSVLKIHILMAILIYLKSLSVFINYINYKYIERIGIQSIVWSSLYYILDFSMGILLFITVILIASGWTIIKSIIPRKTKFILFMVILLQITANAAKIYLDKIDKDDSEYKKIREVFVLTDLLSCVLVLFPAVWTLKQLKRKSQIEEDDEKLILFRKFFVLFIICIYCSRIIPYIIQITVAEELTRFQYAWFDKLFKELILFVCFVATGYIFRPVIQSYLSAISDDVNDIDSIIIPSPIEENFNKVNEHWLPTPNMVNAIDAEEEDSLLSELKDEPLL